MRGTPCILSQMALPGVISSFAWFHWLIHVSQSLSWLSPAETSFSTVSSIAHSSNTLRLSMYLTEQCAKPAPCNNLSSFDTREMCLTSARAQVANHVISSCLMFTTKLGGVALFSTTSCFTAKRGRAHLLTTGVGAPLQSPLLAWLEISVTLGAATSWTRWDVCLLSFL